ncbi:hypothetical protein GDO81_017863 [Engystomops pustulosus]|uniref:Reelin domain-containing protein n=1 Tax=Engystomops pustulosus TaxID=76066 RepID=A0AAV7A2W7_ENGPU|nr:hypothetical protein GDO81_017863 [Engystomops pustulosus]KAG8555928.1 hypothetical protein GDO81_017863 [Engystomops pustulosus]KAG8555929.1 hypothetical protein GDO81_017863 [Engystomops pustulosus]
MCLDFTTLRNKCGSIVNHLVTSRGWRSARENKTTLHIQPALKNIIHRELQGIAMMELPLGIYTFLLLMFFPIHSDGYPNGRVEIACKTMVPQHGVDAQTSASPYVLNFISVNHTGIMGYRVTLQKKEGSASDFRGLMIQARQPGSDIPQGRFVVNSADVQTLNCTTPESTVTHTSRDPKSKVEVIWFPPEKAPTNIQFSATVVQTRTQYWTKIAPAGAATQLLVPALSHLLLCSTALILVLCTN